MENYLVEAFQSLESLNEETFDIDDKDGVIELKDFEEKDELDDTIDIIDIDADDEEELQDSYIGKVILQCDTCDSMVYKDKEDIVIDDDLANVDEECPYCHVPGGFKIIGEVSAYQNNDVDVSAEENGDDVETEVTVDTVEESIEHQVGKLQQYKPEDKKGIQNKEKIKESINRALNNKKLKESELKEARKLGKVRSMRDLLKRNESLKEDKADLSKVEGTITNVLEKNKDALNSVTSTRELYDLCKKLFTENNINTPASNRLLDNISKKRNFVDALSLVYNSMLKGSGLGVNEGCKSKKKSKSMKEAFDKVEIEHEGEKIKIESEPIEQEDVEESDEFIAPISNETKDAIENNDEEDVSVDEIGEEEFDELGESYLKKVYENVESYKTTKATSKGNKITLEGLIKFASGKTKNTKFVFEAKDMNKKGKLRFIGENLNICKGKKAFTIIGSMNGNKFITESFNYNYKAKDNKGKSQRVYGTIKK